MRRAFLLLLLGLWLPAFLALPAWSAELRVQVNDPQNRNGVMRFALYDHAAGFPTYKGRVAHLDVPLPKAGHVEALFADLAPGSYAVAVYHDENANNEFDQGFLGFPLEGYGFSNDARGFLSAPSFASAAVRLGEEGLTIQLRLSY
ncbi:MAG: DUF2141 domain-containing protein [Alphaproteobacteria bacterium]|nr:DUF2141 domain-containing protein [Alphaproteobacteria bacterium]